MYRRGWLIIGICIVTLSSARPAAAQGLLLPGSGPIHRSMAGASTAAPVDAIGANYWNPAAISGLPHSEVGIGGEFIYSESHLASTAPLIGAQGLTRGDNGLSPLSGVGFVHHLEDSPLTLGILLASSAGGGVNYPGDASNPFLAPTGPGGRLRLGPNHSNASFLATMLTLSYQVNDQLAIGAGPILSAASVGLTPAFFATPDDANGDGLFTFPSATNGRVFWGGGFRLGAYYHVNCDWDLGFSFQSPQWFETFKWKSANEVGVAQTIRLPWTLPTVLSWGASYKGFDRWLLAADLRWFDYRNTKTLGQPPSQGGVGWDSVWALALGAQYQLTDRVTLRAGYLTNGNPIDNTLTLFNTQLPGIIEDQISFGVTMQMTENISASFAYVRGFENRVSGPVIQATGSNVSFDVATDSFLFGLNVKFGGCCKSRRCCDADVSCATIEAAPNHARTPAAKYPSVDLARPEKVPVQPILAPSPLSDTSAWRSLQTPQEQPAPTR